MKAWAITKYGDNSNVRLIDVLEPQPASDEVLIQIKAASINPVDFKIRNGDLRFVLRYQFPLILGNDCAGIVTKVGAQVHRFKVGDEVYTRPNKERIGTLAQFIAAHESTVALKPKNITFDQAAGIPLVGLTAWQALLTRGKMQAGFKVFIPAGSGGVGSFAIQLAKHFGAYVATNTSTKNLSFVKSLGADQVIDYTKEDFTKVLLDYDIVFDTMGGETQHKAFGILKPGGQLISIVGPPTWAFTQEMALNPLVQALSAVAGLPAHLRAKRRQATYKFLFMLPSGEDLRAIATLIEEQKIRPIVDQIFPFARANEALAHVESGRAKGKVIVSMNRQFFDDTYCRFKSAILCK